MAVNYNLTKPTQGTKRGSAPTDYDLMGDISDTIADIGARLHTRPLPLQDWIAYGPAIGRVNARAAAYLMAPGTAEHLEREIDFAQLGWVGDTYNVEAWIANAGAGSGNITFEWREIQYEVGDTINSALSSNKTTHTVGAQNVVEKVTVVSGISVTKDVSTVRLASDGTGTLVNDIGILAVQLVKA